MKRKFRQLVWIFGIVITTYNLINSPTSLFDYIGLGLFIYNLVNVDVMVL